MRRVLEDMIGLWMTLFETSRVDVLVSALSHYETEDMGLLEESQCCQNYGLEFFSFPIKNRSVPASFSEFDVLLNSLTDRLRNGKAVGVHCRAGIGRSSIIVASALIRDGLSVDSASRAIEEARGCSVPDTAEQRQWVERYSSRFGSSEK